MMAGSTTVRANQKEKEEEEEEEEECEDDGSSSCVFPTTRVRRLIREGGGENSFRVTHEAVFLINKASEMFLQTFTKDAYLSSSSYTTTETKTKTKTKSKSKSKRDHRKNKFLSYDHLSSLVCDEKRYEFLSDFVPEKVRAEDALKEREAVET